MGLGLKSSYNSRPFSTDGFWTHSLPHNRPRLGRSWSDREVRTSPAFLRGVVALHVPQAGNCARLAPIAQWLFRTAWIVSLFFLSASAFADPTIGLRIEWGRSVDRPSGSERPKQWQGTIGIDHGTISVDHTIGFEADEPGSMWSDGNRVQIHERSRRSNDGVDVTVTAPLTAILRVELRDSQDTNAAPASSEISIADLLAKSSVSTDLDRSANRLIIRRTPGDMLHIVLPQNSLVFAPGDTFRAEVEPRMLPIPAGTSLQLRTRLLTVNGGSEINSQEQSSKPVRKKQFPQACTASSKFHPTKVFTTWQSKP